MIRISQTQVKIAEAIESEGPMTAAQLANTYGARVSNTRRAADYMVENNYLTFWDGRYSLTKLGRDDVLLSHAAITLKRARRNEAQKPVEAAPADLFTLTHIGTDELQWTPTAPAATIEPKADPISDEGFFTEFLDDIFPIVTEAVMLDIAGHNISLSVDDAQELRRSLNNFFEGN